MGLEKIYDKTQGFWSRNLESLDDFFERKVYENFVSDLFEEDRSKEIRPPNLKSKKDTKNYIYQLTDKLEETGLSDYSLEKDLGENNTQEYINHFLDSCDEIRSELDEKIEDIDIGFKKEAGKYSALGATIGYGLGSVLGEPTLSLVMVYHAVLFSGLNTSIKKDKKEKLENKRELVDDIEEEYMEKYMDEDIM